MSKVVIKSSTISSSWPADAELRKAGWRLIASSSDPRRTGAPLVKRDVASDKPARTKVVTDQLSPTTSSNARGKEDLLAAMKLADLEQKLGLNSEWAGDKFARVAELERLGFDTITQRENALRDVSKVASFNTVKKDESKNSGSLPRLASLGAGSTNSSLLDESIFIS